jgi:hypothetical protein
MAPTIIVAVYLLLGAAAAARALARGTSWPLAAVTLLCWPFLLPAPQGGSSREAPRPDTDAGRLTALESALENAWRDAAALGAGRPAERERIGRFVAHLRSLVARVEEMDRALATAAERVRGPLTQLRTRAAADVGEGLSLLEELVAQLTLLRFSGGPGGEAARHEKDHVEALLARIGALAEVSATPAA